jgi:hypothetical protein
VCVCVCVSDAQMYHKAAFHFHMPVPDVSMLPVTLTCHDEF